MTTQQFTTACATILQMVRQLPLPYAQHEQVSALISAMSESYNRVVVQHLDALTKCTCDAATPDTPSTDTDV